MLIIDGHRSAIHDLSIHPTLPLLISQGANGRRVRLWNLSSGEELAPIEVASPIASSTFSADGEQIAVLTADHELTIWTLDGQQIDECDHQHSSSGSIWGSHLRYTSDSEQILIGTISRP